MPRPRAGLVALAPLLALLLVGQGLVALVSYQHALPHMDQYQFLEAAHAVREIGYGRISYWPWSSAGMDVLHWSHHLPPFLYAALDRAIGLAPQDLFVVNFAETLLLAGAVYAFLAGALPTGGAAALTALTLLDPVFLRIFVVDTYSKWPMTFAMLALLSLARARAAGEPARRRLWLAAAGLLASLSPLSFVSVGIPVALGILALMALGGFSRPELAGALLAFTVAPLLFALNFIAHAGTRSALGLLAGIRAYGGHVVVESAGASAAVTSIGRSLVRIVLPDTGFSTLPVALAVLLPSALAWRRLPEHEKQPVQWSLVLVAVWIVLAALFPTHLFTARMSWMLPVLLLGAHTTLRRVEDGRESPPGVLLPAAIVALAQVLRVAAGIGEGLLGTGLLALLTVASAAAATLASETGRMHRTGTRPLAGVGGRNGHATALLVLLGLLSLDLPAVGRELARDLSVVPRLAVPGSSEPMATALAREVRAISEKELRPGERVLSNYPFRELFPGVLRLDLYTYRGLFGGLTARPADRVFLFGIDSDLNIARYPGLGLGKVLRYRNFYYRLERRFQLNDGVVLWVGAPASETRGATVIERQGDVSAAEASRYLESLREAR